MSKIAVTGSSDDSIIIEGDFSEQFDCINSTDKILCFSDGTILDVLYGEIWRFPTFVHGTADVTRVAGDAIRDTNEVVTLDGDIKWAVLVDRSFLAF